MDTYYNIITVCFIILFSCKEVKPFKTSEEVSPTNQETFLYFAYGSNLLAKRIHINNPTAKFFSIAKLPNFRLDFETLEYEYWNGADATIVQDSESVVWGALWTLNVRDIPHLDVQECVNLGEYQVRNVSVQIPDGSSLNARTYKMTVDPPKGSAKDLPSERQPSDTYMKVILYGAFECSLPTRYIRFLFTFPTNGKLSSLNVMEKLGYPFNVTEAI